ncbi:hypothetical protein SCUCBS95973_007825 [Sporothrix curviconia]|uniref:Isochorismatase-like domain-containing protein n=1 Tax=Sporothrix curviconia TaxID=1260050 RepID=A0ABP0CHA8_9PEZI
MATVHGEVLWMGPTGDQWHYHRKERLYDLTRGSSDSGVPAAGLTIRTTAGPPDTRIAVAPGRTALVVVDMQNFFLHRLCRDHPTGRAAVAPTLAAIDACRRAGIRIVWLNWGLAANDLAAMPASIVCGFSRRMVLDDDLDRPPPRSGLGVDSDGDGVTGPWLAKGAWNSNVYEGEEAEEADGAKGKPSATPSLATAVRPDLGDVLCDKTRMSGMWSETEPLRQYLTTDAATANGTSIRTLLFAGVNTDQCVLGTLTDAYNAGWDCVAVADCCATTTPNGQEVTMLNVAQNNLGFVINSKTLGDGVDAYCEALLSKDDRGP